MSKSKDQVQAEALASLRPHHRAGVGISMGVGKTLIGLKHMAENYTNYCKFLVAAPKTVILDEWLNEAKKHGLEYLIPHIELTTYISLPKQGLEYDVVYLDECHSLLDTHDEWLSQYTGKIVGLTGTPPRFKRSEKGKMVSKYCPIVYTYITDNAIGDGILNDYRIQIHYLNLSSAKTMQVTTKDGRSWLTSERDTYDYWTRRCEEAATPKQRQIMSVMRMKAMMTFPSKETYAKLWLESTEDKCILFANTQEQADRLCAHSYHSNNADSEENLLKFKSGEIMKLSAVLQLNEGINVSGLRAGIIMHAYGNERKSSQRIGRLLRLNPDDVATVHILCYKGTVDERWVNDALSGFDQNKISVASTE